MKSETGDHPKLILASASPRRKALLAQIGIIPDKIIAPDIDETPLEGESPRVYARRMATEKAQKIAEDPKNKEAFILAADTVVAFEDDILPKTETQEQAALCLRILSGRCHDVYGGIAVIPPDGKMRTELCDTSVQFKTLTPADTQNLLDSEEWKGVAGGYAIQGLAGAYIKSISGSYSNIVGLSLYATMKLLSSIGYND